MKAQEWKVNQFARVAIAKCHRLGNLNNRNFKALFLSFFFFGDGSRI
jgi:hypothetical protein